MANIKKRCETCPHFSEECYKKYPNDGHFMSDSLCWCCKKSIEGGCSWMDYKLPICGWAARKKTNKDGDISYNVRSCPDFVRG